MARERDHIVRGCAVVGPGPDGIKRHDYTTTESRDAVGKLVKSTKCRHCDADPEDVLRRHKQVAAWAS